MVQWTQKSIVLNPHGPKVSLSQCPLLPKSQSPMVPKSNVSEIQCIQSPMLLNSYGLKVSLSESPMFLNFHGPKYPWSVNIWFIELLTWLKWLIEMKILHFPKCHILSLLFIPFKFYNEL